MLKIFHTYCYRRGEEQISHVQNLRAKVKQIMFTIRY